MRLYHMIRAIRVHRITCCRTFASWCLATPSPCLLDHSLPIGWFTTRLETNVYGPVCLPDGRSAIKPVQGQEAQRTIWQSSGRHSVVQSSLQFISPIRQQMTITVTAQSQQWVRRSRLRICIDSAAWCLSQQDALEQTLGGSRAIGKLTARARRAINPLGVSVEFM